MENQNNNSTQPVFPLFQEALPNSTAVLVMGILSIVFCSFIGLVLGIVALVLAKKDMELFASNPDIYKRESFNQIKTGRTCAIIGIALSSIMVVFLIIYLVVVFGLMGFAMLSGMGNF